MYRQRTIEKGVLDMIIRKAEIKDMERLLDIYNYEVVNGTSTFDLHPKSMEERMEWFNAHNKDNHPLIVAEIDGRAVGYTSLSTYRDKEAYSTTVELSVYVDVDFRRKGVARSLITEILSEARGNEDIHTVVSVITSINEASASLHKEFGFVHCGTIKEVGKKFGKFMHIDNYQLMV